MDFLHFFPHGIFYLFSCPADIQSENQIPHGLLSLSNWTPRGILSDFSYGFACGQDQNQNSLLVKRENDNTSTGLGGGRLVPRSHKDTQSSDSSAEVMRESRRSFQSMIVW